MDRNRTLLAAAAALLSGALAFYLLHQKAEEIAQKSTPTQVLVATRYIPPGSPLRAEWVEKRSVPKAYVAPSAITEVRELEGMLSLVPISAGEQVLSNKFGSGTPGLSSFLLQGQRAYTLGLDEESGVGGLLRPGDRVDLLTKTTLSGREATSLLLQNVEVVAVGQEMGGARKPEDPSLGSAGDYRTITLSLTPEEAEVLFFLEGKPLRLILRAPGDEAMVELRSVSEGEVLARLRRGRDRARSIEIIRAPAGNGENE